MAYVIYQGQVISVCLVQSKGIQIKRGDLDTVMHREKMM